MRIGGQLPARPIRAPRGILAVCAALAAGGVLAAAPGPIVEGGPVLVSASPAPPPGPEATAVAWNADAAVAAGPWDALDGAAANLHYAQSGAGGFGSLLELRGLANTPYFSAPAVTVYLDDLPLDGSFSNPTDLFGFGSATVHRGPQGVEFGNATDGGVIVFSPDELSGRGEALASFGSYGERRGEVRTQAGGPADAAQIQVAAGYDARQGFVDNTEIGERVDDQEREGGFARLAWRAPAGGRFALEVVDERERDGAQPLVPLGGQEFSVERAQNGVIDLDEWGAALRGTFPVAGGTLDTVTSVTDWRMNPYRDFLVLPPPVASEAIAGRRSWNEELRLASAQGSAVGGHLGIWLSRSSSDNAIGRTVPGLGPIEGSTFEQRTSEGAVFGEISWRPLRDWRLSAGARAEATVKDFARQETAPVRGLDTAGGGRYGALLPRAALDWNGGGGESAELSIASGLRPGGFSSYTGNPALMSFPAERVTAAAASWTARFGRGSGELTLRAFDDQIANEQIERSFTATDYFVAAASRASSRGAELELRWRPLAGLAIGVSAGWTEAVLDRYRAPLTGQDLSGNAAPYVPLDTAGVSAAYRWAGGWFASARFEAVGRTYFDELESTAFEQRAYATVAARLGYRAGRWTAALAGENLGDRRYYDLIVPDGRVGAPGAPRTVDVETAVRW
jgi:iron complex outermembrane recepter protein